MERISIQAERRDGQGKGNARSLRRDGKVPAVLYRAGKAQAIQLSQTELAKLIKTVGGEQVMVDLQFSDGEKKLALLKDFQVDPIRSELLHTDFFEVSLTETVRITVHVTTKGEPIGLIRSTSIRNRWWITRAKCASSHPILLPWRAPLNTSASRAMC